MIKITEKEAMGLLEDIMYSVCIDYVNEGKVENVECRVDQEATTKIWKRKGYIIETKESKLDKARDFVRSVGKYDLTFNEAIIKLQKLYEDAISED